MLKPQSTQEISLDALVRSLPHARLVPADAGSVVVSGAQQDSRHVASGDLFIARAGLRLDGSKYINDAVSRGARAVLLEPGALVDSVQIPRIEVANVPLALAAAAHAIYGDPTAHLEVVGITGTNGKTTTAHLVQAVIDHCGGHAGIVGTLGYRFDGLDMPAQHTTPEADALARVAAAMRERGASHLVMEVSSIALAAHRVDHTRFSVAAFTNMTQDHLDYHGTMASYGQAKERLFTDLAPRTAAIQVDEPFGRALAERFQASFAQHPLARISSRIEPSSRVEVAPLHISQDANGTMLEARTPAGNVQVRSPLLGIFNVENLLTALSIAWLLGLDVREAAEALSRPVPVPGRLERCDVPGQDDIMALVDYAHTPDALQRTLASVRGLGSGRIWCVFGCGGDRDAGKRSLMGAAVGAAADIAIVTNDNPRGENPQRIADAILDGLRESDIEVQVQLDRAMAIERAIQSAKAGDLVLIAGKGHEPYQIVGDVTSPFDDREEVRRALTKRRTSRGLNSGPALQGKS
ncbi:UDP-N-acetylmuramoyl-L-alanyl-D-glutamate--2,6-diaminopimelate ligase [Chondromyces crocatus]|uniref:UDP-N-acetylmuramoyl-L-alanyl-D-glutamate--2,6-diaminopimelate ligase n=1 Tax=Chondromyces crocatus TaxID=52 RepID=A0A0K1ENX1_CHOCO|nr:UDP-N-acetylmuramoyl-L-alanyl-D-glutamate--2,6-diaminopimelate ligase [Chondromyces crocatus]AKT42318.1 UDP-N-acetylmuramoylalanyl-D-glutamate--2, 6-diaminopimelate ligase [Chondromyces crocatus]